MRATYNITDDKLKLWLDERLSPGAYQEAKACRFTWWPGSKCFVAKWNPEAENFIRDRGIEIAEDDAPDDVESRVDRFAARAEDAEKSAENASDHLQSERCNTERRRQNAINATEKNLELAAHWQRRIDGAIRHAAMKENPGVIARRIKGLMTDLRRQEKLEKASTQQRAMWDDDGLTLAGAKNLANYEPGCGISRCFTKDKFPLSTYEGQQSLWGVLDKGQIDLATAKQLAIDHHAAQIDRAQRWIAHLNNRLTYEKALLVAAGVPLAALTPARRKPAPVTTDTVGGTRPEVMGAFGGRGYVFKLESVGVDDWFLITKVNKKTVEYLSSSMIQPGNGGDRVRRFSIHKTEIYGLRFLRTPAEVAKLNPNLLEDWAKVEAIRARIAERKAIA